MGLGASLFFARNLLGYANWYAWQNLPLTRGESLTQRLAIPGAAQTLTGVRLRLVEASDSAILQLCLYRDGNAQREPLACASRSAAERVENQVLYFLFDQPVSLGPGDTPTVSIQVEGEGATALLPYTTSMANALQLGKTDLEGSLDLSPLAPFSLKEAFDQLVVKNILSDWRLLLAIGLTIVLVSLFFASTGLWRVPSDPAPPAPAAGWQHPRENPPVSG